MKNPVRFVKLLHSVEVDEHTLGIYNPILGHHLAFIQKELFSQLQKASIFEASDELKELSENHFIVPENFSEGRYIESLRKNLTNDIHLMYLLLTQDCNLACTYCFEDLQRKARKQMPWEVASRAIDYFLRVSSPERKVIFYGGEPFLNKEVFRKSVEKLKLQEKSLQDRIKLSAVTNGTCIDNKIAAFIKEADVEIAVSIDGPAEIHNSARPKRTMEASYNETVRGYDLLKQAGVNPSISCTVGPHNVRQLSDIALFFAKELKPIAVGFNFLIKHKKNQNEESCSIEEATNAVLLAYKVLKDHGIYEDRIMRRINPIIENKCHIKDCAAYGNQIAVRYDGKVGACHAFCTNGKYFTGNIANSSFEMDWEIRESWSQRSQLNMTSCSSCPLLTLCGGGCAYNAYHAEGRLDALDRQTCTHTKMLLNWVLKETWKRKRLN